MLRETRTWNVLNIRCLVMAHKISKFNLSIIIFYTNPAKSSILITHEWSQQARSTYSPVSNTQKTIDMRYGYCTLKILVHDLAIFQASDYRFVFSKYNRRDFYLCFQLLWWSTWDIRLQFFLSGLSNKRANELRTLLFTPTRHSPSFSTIFLFFVEMLWLKKIFLSFVLSHIRSPAAYTHVPNSYHQLIIIFQFRMKHFVINFLIFFCCFIFFISIIFILRD